MQSEIPRFARNDDYWPWRHSRRRLIGAAVVAAALAGCGGLPFGRRPPPTETPTPEPTPTVDPASRHTPTPAIRTGTAGPVVPPVATPTPRRLTQILAWDDLEDDSPAGRAQRTLLRRFHDQNPGVRVDARPRPPPEAAARVFQMANASGTTPDVFADLTPELVRPSVEQGWLAPLEAMVRAWAPTSRLLPAVWAAYRDEERVVGIPRLALPLGLIWRRDAFAAAGLAPDRPPRTWDELAARARTLTTPDRARFGFGQVGGRLAPDFWEPFVAQAGGALTAPAAGGRLRLAFADAAGAEALRFYRALRAEHAATQALIDADEAAIVTDFLQGRAAMMIAPATFLARVGPGSGLDGLVGFAAPPAGPRDGRATVTRGRAYAIAARAGPATRAAAWTYVSFMADPERRAERRRLIADAGGALEPEAPLFQGEETGARADWAAGLTDAVAIGRPPYAGREDVGPELAATLALALARPDLEPVSLLREAAKRIVGSDPRFVAE